MSVKAVARSAILATVLVAIFPHPSSYLDFTVGYWQPSRMLLEGNNPYAFCDLACLGSSVDAASLGGLNPSGMIVMYNPAVFPLFFPWAVLPFRVASVLYLFLFVFSVSLVFQNLAESFTRGLRLDPTGRLVFWISAIPIGLLVQNVLWGSPSWIALSGVVLFLTCFRSRPFVAGLFLSLTLIKIHLFVIFGAAVLACCFRARNWRTPIGFVTAAAVCVMSAVAFRRDIFAIYSEVASSGQPFHYVNATVPSVARYLFNLNGASYLLLPWLLVGVVMFRFFWLTESSDLTRKLCCILPFSVGFAPYAWGHDYICAAPVLVIAAAYVVDGERDRRRRGAAFVCLLALNVFAVVLALAGTTAPILQLIYGAGLMAAGFACLRSLQPSEHLRFEVGRP